MPQPSPGGTQGQCLCGPEDRLKRVLMVRRLHPAVTMQMLLQTFGVFGSVTGCKVFTHKSGRSAGCASLEFASHQAACAALQGLQGTLLHGKHVMLQWFDQSLSSATSPVGRGPGQRSELSAGPLSEGGNCAAIAARQLSSGANNAGPIRSSTASCPGLSPFGMFASAAPGAHPFCNSTAAMAAAAAAAAVAAQQQQLQHSNDAAATAAALLSGQHNLPPLVVQQLQRQVSAPLGAFGQLSPTGAHIPPSPLTPGSHGGGWEALMSPADQPQRSATMSSRGGAGCEQQGWGAPAHSPAHIAAAAKLSAAMSTGSLGGCAQDSLNMAASLQQLASMQQQAYAYAAWQNQQQAAAALLQQQYSAQLPASPMLSSQASAQHAQQMTHLLSARSMPNELSNCLSADFLLQQATASLQAQQQQAQQQHHSMDSSEGGIRGVRSSAGAAMGLGRQQSMPAGSALLSGDAAHCAASPGLLQQVKNTSSAGGADSIPAAGAGNTLDQAPGGIRVRSPGSARRKSTGAPGARVEGADSKAGADGQQTAKKHLHWEDQRQGAGDRKGAASGGHGTGSPAGAGKAGSGSAEGGRISGRSSSHQLMSPLRGYSGSDDTANVSPDVNALASAQAAAAAAAAVSSCYLSSPTWLDAQRHGLSTAQVTPELLANLQGPSLGAGGLHSSLGMQRSPSAAALMQQQQNFLLAAAVAATSSPGSSAGFVSSFAQQQQQLERAAAAASCSREQLSRVSDSQVLMGGRSGGDGNNSSSNSYPQPGMLFTSPSLPGPSAVEAALDAMTVSAAMAPAHSWQQKHAGAQGPAAAAEAPASEAFKHKHKMHLQLPAQGASAASKSNMSGGGGDRLNQLITTEVLPESPAQQQRGAAHSPFSAAGAAAGAGDTGSAWADWSASMAALLSPAHVTSFASRRFEDLITLQHGMAQEAAAAAAAQGQAARMQQQQQPQSTPGAVDAAALRASGKLGSTSSQAAWLLQQSRADQQQQQQQSGFAAVASRPGSLLTSAGSDVFGAATGESMSEGGAGSLLGKTKHNSLCLDSRPGLLTLSHMFQEAAAQQGSGRPSPRGVRANSPQQQQQQLAAARRAAAGEPGDINNAGFGSFSFQPPVLRSLQASGLSAASGGSSSTNSNLMICQPFQLPDFFSRDGRINCPSPRGSVSTPGAASAAAAGAGATAGRDAQGVGSPLHPSGIQHQFSENLNGLCIAEESFSGGLDGTDRAPGSPVGARHLQHSFSMPARFSAPGGVGDALAAAAAAAVAAGGQHEHEGQQQGERAAQAQYGDVFKNIWGPNSGSSGSMRG